MTSNDQIILKHMDSASKSMLKQLKTRMTIGKEFDSFDDWEQSHQNKTLQTEINNLKREIKEIKGLI